MGKWSGVEKKRCPVLIIVEESGIEKEIRCKHRAKHHVNGLFVCKKHWDKAL